MSELGNGHRHHGTAEILSNKTTIEVAHKNTVNVFEFKTGAGHGWQGRIPNELFEVGVVEFAKWGMTPTNHMGCVCSD